MKKFEILFLALLVSLIIYSCTNNETATDFQQSEGVDRIGTLVDGELIFDNKSAFKAEWEQNLRADGINVELANYEIEYTDFVINGKPKMILVAQSADQTFKTAMEVEEVNSMIIKVISSTVVSCSGCSIGCNPRKVTIDSVEQWICTSCFDTSKECTKTVIVTTGNQL